MLKPRFSVFSAKICIFKPTPQKLGTLFVNTAALTDFLVLFFSIFAFWGFCGVQFFGGLFLRGMKRLKKKTQNSKQNKIKERRPQDANNKTTQSCFFKEKTRQHRHKIIQIKCLRWKQTTQEKTHKDQNMKLTTIKLPCSQHDQKH